MLALLVDAADAPAAGPAPARVCVPFADRVLAWSADADLYVVATYHERKRPPPATTTPNLLELRRLSSGAQVALVNCALRPGQLRAGAVRGPCDFRIAFAGQLPKDARFEGEGEARGLAGLAVRMMGEGDQRAPALVTRARQGRWERVRWLAPPARPGAEKVTFRLVAGARSGGERLLVLASHHEGGGCPRTEARMLRLREADVVAPGAPEHQAWLLARLREASPFELWRTAAEIAPIPPHRIVAAMVAAAEAERPDFGARWWAATAAAVPVETIAPIATAVRTRPELGETRRLIGLPDRDLTVEAGRPPADGGAPAPPGGGTGAPVFIWPEGR